MFKALSKFFGPAPLTFLFDDIAKQFDLLPLAVKRAIQGAAPKGMRLASISPFLDDGGDASGRGWTRGQSDLKVLMVQFVPNLPAWDSKDQVTIDIVLTPATADLIRPHLKRFNYGYRFAARSSWAPPALQVTA